MTFYNLDMNPEPAIPFLIPTSKPGHFEMHMDNSSKELFETCARAAEYYVVRRREGTADRPSLFRGGVVHGAIALRELYPTKDFEHMQVEYILNQYKDRDFGPDEWRTAERCIDTILKYNKAWPIETEPFRILADKVGKPLVEVPFKIAMGHADLGGAKVETHAGTLILNVVEIYWTGRIDALVEYGVILDKDIKTTSILGQNFYDDFQLSSQMQSYTWAARKLGFDCKGLLLDVIASRRPTRTGVADEFQRQRIYHTEQHLAEWERDTFTLVEDFLEHLCRGYFPKSPKWCFGKYGRCQYWDICTQIPEHREAMLHSDLYRNVTWSPLNTNHNIEKPAYENDRENRENIRTNVSG